ncbi:hypothetical protein N7461_005100 [Penicillium sp. DV-2018c]|nr:hypothetical protein N7461_005100 [Penicillium sp. DV-2018c]
MAKNQIGLRKHKRSKSSFSSIYRPQMHNTMGHEAAERREHPMTSRCGYRAENGAMYHGSARAYVRPQSTLLVSTSSDVVVV